MTSSPLPPTASACGGTLASTPLEREEAVDLARTFKALADPSRVRLLSLVAAHEGGEACVCDITGPVGLSQATVSHHLKVLVEAGLLSREQRGTWAFYSVVPGALGRVARLLDGIDRRDVRL